MTSERDPTRWVSKKPRQPVKRGESHDPIHTYGRLMCWRRHGTQLTPLGQTLHSTSNAFTKSWRGRGYRRALAEVSGTNHVAMIACMFSTKSRKVKAESILIYHTCGPLFAGGWSHTVGRAQGLRGDH